MSEDIQFMRRVLDLAQKGYGTVSPNPMVGALVVKDGEIIGEGYHQAPGMPHAEVLALDEAGPQARGATLYVNLEPCCHFGRTPPCVDKIISSGIKKVVCGIKDPNPLVAGKGFEKLKESGIQLVVPVLEKEARQINESFIKHITTGVPFVTCKYAMTLDGKISTFKGCSKWISGEEARSYVHHLRKGADGILTGVGTVAADDPQLTCRLEEEISRQPVRIVVDSTLKISLKAKVLSDNVSQTIIATTERSSILRRKNIQQMGIEVLVLPQDTNGRVDLKQLVGILGKRGFSSLLLEGGPGIITGMFTAGLIDKFIVFIAPKLLGGQGAPSPVGGKGVEEMEEAVVLDGVKIEVFGNDVMFTGYVPKDECIDTSYF